jgi:hypothetical protein
MRPSRFGGDDAIADRLQRHLRAFLFLEDRLLDALARGDVGDGAFIGDDLLQFIAHDARALEHHDLRAVAPPQQRIRRYALRRALQFVHELRARGRIPVQDADARQRVDLLGILCSRASSRTPGLTASTLPVGRELVHALEHALVQSAKARLAGCAAPRPHRSRSIAMAASRAACAISSRSRSAACRPPRDTRSARPAPCRRQP